MRRFGSAELLQLLLALLNPLEAHDCGIPLSLTTRAAKGVAHLPAVAVYDATSEHLCFDESRAGASNLDPIFFLNPVLVYLLDLRFFFDEVFGLDLVLIAFPLHLLFWLAVKSSQFAELRSEENHWRENVPEDAMDLIEA